MKPPGSLCLEEALVEITASLAPGRFLEVGCGDGSISELLCRRGWSGTAIDFSTEAVIAAADRLKPWVQSNQFNLIQTDLQNLPPSPTYDLVLALMVIEHVEDDGRFLERMKSFCRPGGHVVLAVPARKDKWSYEDETVGHFRRYDRKDLETLLLARQLQPQNLWSISVPVSNILFPIGLFLLKRSAELEKKNLSKQRQTELSGVQEIPFKTQFPSFFKLVLNKVTLWPVLFVQRWFYRTNLGLTLLACAQVPPATFLKSESSRL